MAGHGIHHAWQTGNWKKKENTKKAMPIVYPYDEVRLVQLSQVPGT